MSQFCTSEASSFVLVKQVDLVDLREEESDTLCVPVFAHLFHLFQNLFRLYGAAAVLMEECSVSICAFLQ